MASHNILSKTDRALVAYLISCDAGTAADIFPAKLSLDKPLPCTICYSERAREITPHTAVYEVTVAILVRTDPSIDVGIDEDEPKETSETRVGDTFDCFFDQVEHSGHELADAITSAARAADADLAAFTVQDIEVTGQEAGFENRGGANAWTDTLNLTLIVCPANVS